MEVSSYDLNRTTFVQTAVIPGCAQQLLRGPLAQRYRTQAARSPRSGFAARLTRELHDAALLRRQHYVVQLAQSNLQAFNEGGAVTHDDGVPGPAVKYKLRGGTWPEQMHRTQAAPHRNLRPPPQKNSMESTDYYQWVGTDKAVRAILPT